jgi:glycosyltransferase involved in cell wall biosynthesis
VSIALDDGFPATIFEAMACGCPLVVSNDRSYDGVVVDGTNAITISPTDTKALSSAFTRILADPMFADDIRGGVEDKKEISWVNSDLSVPDSNT